MKRRFFRLALLFLAAWLIPLSAQAGGVFRFPLFWVPSSLDPVKDEQVSTYHIVLQVYDGLVSFDSNLRVVPGLAQTWTVSRDGKEYLFTLRKGVRFHNGEELTSRDVVASLTRIFASGSQTAGKKFLYKIEGAREFREGRAGKVSGISAVGPYQVLIALKEPYPAFLSVLGMPVTRIAPAALVENPENPLDRNPVGTGPFRFESWEDRVVTLAANPGYFRGRPDLDGVKFIFYPGELRDRAFTDFLEGKLDGCDLPGDADPKELRERGYQVLIRPRLSLLFYGMDTRVPPFDDPMVRKAVSLSFDREKLAREVMHSKHQPAFQIFPPGMPGYTPDNALLRYDPARAAQLMKMSRYPKPGSIPDLAIASVSHSNVAREELELFRRNMAELGIKVTPLFVENWETFKEGIEKGRYPMFRYALYADIPDPEDFLPDLVGTGAAQNFTGYSDEKVDSILEAGRTQTDPMKRTDLYREGERMVLDSPPLMPVLFLTTQVAFQANVRNLELPATGTPYLPLDRFVFSDRP